MRLYREGPVSIDQGSILAKFVAAHDLGIRGQRHDLILMPGIQCHGLPAEIVVLRADRPALGCLMTLPPNACAMI